MAQHSIHLADPNIDVITGVCPHDCPDTCSWQVAVDRSTGQAVDIWGHPDHPVTQGRLCTKVDNYLERTYHGDRLTTPLKRMGPKGTGQFVAVGWDEAIADIAVRLQAIIAQHGAEAVLPYSYAGTMGILQGDGLAQAFFNRMGASRLARTICSQAGTEGYTYTVGATEGTETESFAQAKLILIWGSNTLTSNLHLWPFVQEARKQGANVIVIDPARTRTAKAADEWIPINPGADAALALALIHVIIAENLHDTDYVERYTVGLDQLARSAGAWTPERAATVTGVDAERIRSLARQYATTQPAAIRINYGLQRHTGGGMAVRTIACLPALVGAWRHPGGGVQLSNSGSFRHMDRTSIIRPDLLAGRTPRTLNMIALGDALSPDPARLAQAHHHPRPVDPIPSPAQAGPPVKALVVYNCNPAAIAPDQAAVLAGLARDDLFTVVLEHFQTDTADYADYVLPATTQLEHWDILKPYGHLHLGLNRPAIAPVGESLANSEIFRRLAGAMGYDDDIFRTDDETLLRTFVESQTHPRFAPITWPKLLADGFARLDLPTPNAPFAQGTFPTSSGKCEFFSQRMAEDGYEQFPMDNAQWTMGRPDSQSPIPNPRSLICISPPAHSFLNSSFVNVARFTKREGEPVVWVHPADGADLGVADGESVRVWNERGEVTLTARLTADIVPGTVLAPGVWWAKLSPDGHNINQVTPQAQTDMGGGATFYDARVHIEKGIEHG